MKELTEALEAIDGILDTIEEDLDAVTDPQAAAVALGQLRECERCASRALAALQPTRIQKHET